MKRGRVTSAWRSIIDFADNKVHCLLTCWFHHTPIFFTFTFERFLKLRSVHILNGCLILNILLFLVCSIKIAQEKITTMTHSSKADDVVTACHAKTVDFLFSFLKSCTLTGFILLVHALKHVYFIRSIEVKRQTETDYNYYFIFGTFSLAFRQN